eukprot:snap_masked-scaffold_44-processed-gene-1.27-mRNA-1 protein AED:0.65 eAED:0.65 QI:0/-1/0/1/-1/1/1/0/77
MTSGFGVKSATGRCYPFWVDFKECLNAAEEPSDCNGIRKYYFNCIRNKEVPWQKKDMKEVYAMAESATVQEPQTTNG